MLKTKPQRFLASWCLRAFALSFSDDIRNRPAVLQATRGCDMVIHLASLLGGRRDDPAETIAVGLVGTWNVLEANPARALVDTSRTRSLLSRQPQYGWKQMETGTA